MKKVLLLSIGLVFMLGCIDPVKFNFSEQVNHVVIQSTFNNKKGPQFVRVAKSSAFGTTYNLYVNNANVYITSAEGEKYQFKFSASGKYFSDANVAAIPGHTYTLHVEFDGKAYESEAVKMFEETKIVKIDKLHFKFAQRLAIVKGAKDKKILPGYDILVDYKDPAGEKSFYRWSFHRIYQVEAQPENYVEYSCRGCPRPAPKACCKHCWVTESDDILSTADDWLQDGQNIKNQAVMFIPFYQYMNKKMVLTIYQHVISEGAHNYFKALDNQVESTGSMFDAPPTELKGNVYNVADKTEKVIGYFEASSTSSAVITIKGTEVDFNIPPFDYPDDCLLIPNSTTVKPTNW